MISLSTYFNIYTGFSIQCFWHPLLIGQFMIQEKQRKKQEQKEKNKKLLLQRLLKLKITSQKTPPPSVIYNSQPKQIQNQNQILRQKQENKDSQPVQASEKQLSKNMRIESGSYYSKQQKQAVDDEYDKDGDQNKEPKKNQRIKRPYYQHYSKQGVFEPILQYIRDHPNPSGKPSDIPPQMYEGIQVVPKRPWVFFGPENIPPSDCQQINQKNFSIIFQKAKRQKKQGSGLLKNSNSKNKKKRNDDDISQISDQFTSNFTFSDSVDLSKESDLISQFRSQTKTYKNYDSGNAEDSQVDDDFSSVSGSVTQRHRYNLFDSSESQQEQQSSIQASKRRNKFKKLLDSSDQQAQKSSINQGSSNQGSSAPVHVGSQGNMGSAGISQQKGSSVKVEIDQAQSSISMSRSKSRSKSKSQIKISKQSIKKSKRLRKKEEDSDS